MAVGYGLEDLLTGPLPELDYSFLVAGGAEVAAFAREGQKILVIAVLAFDASEPIVEHAAIKIAVYHLFYMRAEEAVLGGEALVIDLLKSLKVILDALVIQGILRFAGAVYERNVWRRLLQIPLTKVFRD